tara:strand:+ start:458 stop:874 length:417 start_codon:yes stop_codon:yes gene_type:complete
MTILEASGHLYNWFRDNDSFCLEEDFMKIITITEEPDRDRATFLCALKKLEGMNMISNEFSPLNHKQYWVLQKAFLTYEQSVSVSPDLALTISDIINKYCETTGNTVDVCDPAEIKEQDLKNLIYVANILVSEKEQDE